MLLLTVIIAALGLLAIVLRFNTSWIPGPLDAKTRLDASATRTANHNGGALDLGSGFAPKNAGQPHSAVIDTTALDLSSGNETYAFTIQQSVDNSTWVTVTPSVSITAVGVKAIPVFVSARYVRAVLAAGGTTPSITYEAWLVPIQ